MRWKIKLVPLLASLLVPVAVLMASTQAFAAYSFNGSDAASYADTYWSSYNTAYPAFSDDCTNFVSQSLAAGYLPEIADFDAHTGLYVDTTDNNYWFYDNGAYSNSWTVAADLYDSLMLTGYGTLYATRSGASTQLMTGMVKGDVLFYNWGEYGNPTGTAGINHATIQTGYGTTTDGYTDANYVDAHTQNHYHVLWSLITYNQNAATTTIYLVHINPS